MENTNKDTQFSLEIINKVWEKGIPDPSFDSNKFRKDFCGAWIIKDSYGVYADMYGWGIDYIIPLSQGGTDDISNLQPLQWMNNRNKQDNYPNWSCKVTSSNNINIEIESYVS